MKSHDQKDEFSKPTFCPHHFGIVVLALGTYCSTSDVPGSILAICGEGFATFS